MGKSRFAVVFATLLIGGAVLAADPGSVDQSVIDQAYARLRARQTAASAPSSNPSALLSPDSDAPAVSASQILSKQLEQMPDEDRPKADTGWDAFSTEDAKKFLDRPGVQNQVVTEQALLVGIEIYRASNGTEHDAAGWDLLLYFQPTRVEFAGLDVPVWLEANHNTDGYTRELAASSGRWAESCIHVWANEPLAKQAMQWNPGVPFAFTGRIAAAQLAPKGAHPDQWPNRLSEGKFGPNKIKPKPIGASAAGALRVRMEDCELIQVSGTLLTDEADPAIRRNLAATPGDANKRVEYLCCATARMSGSPFKEIQEQLKLAIGYLSADDQFNLLFIQDDPWATHPTAYVPCFPSLAPASHNAKRDATDAIEAAKPQGSSSPIPAIQEAASHQPTVVFVIWKGDFDDPDPAGVQAALVDLQQKTHAKIFLVDVGVSQAKPPTNPDEFETYRRLAKACNGVFLDGDGLTLNDQSQPMAKHVGASDAP